MENNIKRYSRLSVVEYKQMSATSALSAAPHPIKGRNAIMDINTQDMPTMKAALRGSAKIG